MEGLASILVFVVLVASVTMMIMVSLRITHVTTVAAENSQIEAGAVLVGANIVFPALPDDDDDQITIVHGTGTIGFDLVTNVSGTLTVTEPQPTSSAVPIRTYRTNGFIAFEPGVPVPPGP